MQIELRNFREDRRLSQDTSCFSADLYIDGTKRGTVANRGCGGCHEFSDRVAEREIDEFAKTQPDRKILGYTIPCSAEIILNEIVTNRLITADFRKRFKRTIKTKIIFKLPDGHLYMTTTGGDYQATAAWVKAKHADAIILNELPEATALAIYITAG